MTAVALGGFLANAAAGEPGPPLWAALAWAWAVRRR